MRGLRVKIHAFDVSCLVSIQGDSNVPLQFLREEAAVLQFRGTHLTFLMHRFLRGLNFLTTENFQEHF